MRISPGFCPRAGLLALTVATAAVTLGLGTRDIAHASGPVERLVQVLLSPTDPQVVVVRWGAASQGYLFSRDGGHTFKAMCSAAITPDAAPADRILRLSGQYIPSAAATLIDTHGKLVVSQTNGLWSDDGTGCSWTKQLDGLWPYSIKRDPKLQDELIAVVNQSSNMGMVADARLLRRDASGKWSDFSTSGALIKPADMQRAYGGDLLVSSTASGTQMYASVQVAKGALSNPASSLLVGSSDGGKTWSDPVMLPMADNFVLLAIDPNEPKRILASEYRDNAPDTLMLSEDSGKTWSMYAQIQETSGITFAPDGRVFVSDSGDASGGSAIGGLWTAAKLGDPLVAVAGTTLLDCVQFDPTSKKLFVCKRDTVGLMDPTSGAFEKLIDLVHVSALIDCPGTDIAAACKDQLNAGASWCCTGHYPCTAFCGQYDVTMHDGMRLYCGVSGRAYDESIGLTCDNPGDGGVPSSPDAGSASGGNISGGSSESDARVATHQDASVGHLDGSVNHDDAGATVTPSTGGDGGCAVAVPTKRERSGAGVLVSVGFLLTVLGRSLRRRRR